MRNKSIYLVWFIALLPAMVLRDYTPNNELRYLSIVDEALRNGDIFTFTNQGEIYADKPPLYFWLMMAGKTLLGGHRIWFLSLLSLVPAMVIVSTMTKWIRRENPDVAPEAALMLITCGLFAGLGIVVRMDMLMSMFIVLSLHTFYKIYKGEARKRDQYLFGIYVFLAIFSKGPIGLLVPLLSTLAFLFCMRRIALWKQVWGWKTLLILVSGSLIWFGGVYLESGAEYLDNLLVHQTVGRGINAFHHKRSFYYYLVSIWYSLAPWMFLSIGVIVAALFKGKIKTDIERFFLTIILVTLVLLSVISSKLAVYLLPAFPFFIYLSAILLKKFDSANRWLRLSVALPAMVLSLALPAVIYLSVTDKSFFFGLPIIYAAVAITSITGVAVLFLIFWKKELLLSIRVISLGVLLTVFIAGWGMPQLNPYIGWEKLCEKARQVAVENGISDYSVYRIKRAENMDVFLDEDIEVITKEDIVGQIYKSKILMLPEKVVDSDAEIRSALQFKENYKVGQHLVVVL